MIDLINHKPMRFDLLLIQSMINKTCFGYDFPQHSGATFKG